MAFYGSAPHHRNAAHIEETLATARGGGARVDQTAWSFCGPGLEGGRRWRSARR